MSISLSLIEPLFFSFESGTNPILKKINAVEYNLTDNLTFNNQWTTF